MAPKSVSQVRSALKLIGRFASAQELYKSMHNNGAEIGLTTVYRSLQTLVDENEVDVLRRLDGDALYRLCGDSHHHHLVCRKCGRTVEIEGGAIEKWARAVETEYGFRDVDHTVELLGTCSHC